MEKAKGLNVTRKRRKDGRVVEYFYDRASGTFLGHDRTEAEAKLQTVARPAIAPGSISNLVAEYRASTHFKLDLAPKTRELYGRYLDLIVTEWGDLPVNGLKPGHIERIKSRYEETPRKANLIIAVLRIILAKAVKWDWIPSNPAAKPGLIPIRPRTTVWTDADEQQFIESAPPSLRLAFALMLYTVQRPADVLAMTRAQAVERGGRLWLTLRQQKTNTLVAIPVHARLEPLLLERLADPDGILLVPSPKGFHWAYRNFCRKWDIAMKKASMEGLQRRDLRRTGIVRMRKPEQRRRKLPASADMASTTANRSSTPTCHAGLKSPSAPWRRGRTTSPG